MTFELFHPAAFGGGIAVAVILGGTLSTPMISKMKLDPGSLRSSTDN
jgi:hypothetical protein